MSDIEQGKQKFQVSSCLVSHIERVGERKGDREKESERERKREIGHTRGSGRAINARFSRQSFDWHVVSIRASQSGIRVCDENIF